MSEERGTDSGGACRPGGAGSSDERPHRAAPGAFGGSDPGKLVFQAARDGIVLHEFATEATPGCFIEANPAICAMLGYSSEEMRALTPLDIEDTGDLANVPAEAEEMAAAGGRRFRKTLLGKDGQRVATEIHSTFFERDGKQLVLSIIRDVTEQQTAQRLGRALNEITQAIHSAQAFHRVMQGAVSTAVEAVGCDTAAVAQWKDNRWVISFAHGFAEDVMGVQIRDEEAPHAVLAIRTRQPVAVSDAFNDERVNREYLREQGVRSVIVAPLVVRGDAFGALFLNWHRPAAVSGSPYVDFATRLSSSLSLAVENSLLFQALRESDERSRAQAEELAAANEELQAQQGELAVANEELRAQQEALREGEERFNAFMDNAPVVAWAKDEGGRYVYMNAPGHRFDVRVADCHGKTDFDLWPPEIARTFRENDLQVLRTGQPVGAIEETRNQQGDVGCWLTTKFPFGDASGRIYIGGVAIEITEQWRAEVELARNERLLDAIFENILAQVAYLDNDLRFVRVNAAYADGCGRPAEELIGRKHFDLFPNEENEAIFTRVRDTGEPYVARAKPFVYADQPERGVTYWDWWLRPIKGVDGKAEGVVLSLVDVTGIERARRDVALLNERLREADRRKDEFLAMLAHELRNPLAAISGAVQLMEMRRLEDPVLARARDAAARQSRHMARLLDDLLDVSRVTQGKIVLREEDVSLSAIVESAMEAVGSAIREREHDLRLSVPEEGPRVHGDPVRLAQVVSNLLGNAAKYTPPRGEIHLSVETDGDEAVVRVRDNGTGIAPDVLPRIFDLFVQADNSPGWAQGGLGIGLTMVRSLVVMHGGRVEAHSEGIGRGSEFVVRLPMVQVQAAPVEEEADAGPAAQRRRILVVDDNADAAELLAMILEDLGHEAVAAHSGAAALKMAPAYRPDVMLLDIGMPGMDGYEVARRLRRVPELAGTVLVALTGYSQDEDRERTREAGFDHHLVKPVDPDTLRRVLATAA